MTLEAFENGLTLSLSCLFRCLRPLGLVFWTPLNSGFLDRKGFVTRFAPHLAIDKRDADQDIPRLDHKQTLFSWTFSSDLACLGFFTLSRDGSPFRLQKLCTFFNCSLDWISLMMLFQRKRLASCRIWACSESKEVQRVPCQEGQES